MELSETNLNALSQLNFKSSNNNIYNAKYIIYEAENYLYKIIDTNTTYQKIIERNIDYLSKNNIPNVPKIIDKIYYNNKFYGYIVENIKGSITFKEAIFKEIDTNLKIKAIIDIHKALKALHEKKITLGEINLECFIIDEQGGYIINLDNIHYPYDDNTYKTTYDVKTSNNSPKYKDIVKMMISSLSLMVNMDLEKIVSPKTKCISLDYIYSMVIPAIGNKKLDEYFKRIMNGEEIYFDDFIIENGYYNNINEEENQIKTS